MCFSAVASFGLGGALIISRAIQHQVKPFKLADPGFLLSLFPMIFGVQQIIEGVIWLSMDYAIWKEWKNPFLYAFIFIAQVIWPLAVPLAFLRFERNSQRKSILKVLTIIGVTTSTYLLFCIVFLPIDVYQLENHLVYELRFGNNTLLTNGILYFIPTVLPAFFSSNKKAYIFGSLVLLSFILSKLLFPTAFISVWCYFAAGISLAIYWLLSHEKKRLKS
jgi:hypothetical protein